MTPVEGLEGDDDVSHPAPGQAFPDKSVNQKLDVVGADVREASSAVVVQDAEPHVIVV